MVDLVLGIAAAIGASTLYSLGIALQAMDAKEAPREAHLRLELARGLIRRARWLLGTGLSILGFPLQVVALLLAPLVVVQPALAAGLLVLLMLGQRMLGERGNKSGEDNQGEGRKFAKHGCPFVSENLPQTKCGARDPGLKRPRAQAIRGEANSWVFMHEISRRDMLRPSEETRNGPTD